MERPYQTHEERLEKLYGEGEDSSVDTHVIRTLENDVRRRISPTPCRSVILTMNRCRSIGVYVGRLLSLGIAHYRCMRMTRSLWIVAVANSTLRIGYA